MAPREHATLIHAGTPESADVVAGIRRAWRLVTRLNALSADDADAVRACFAELTGREISQVPGCGVRAERAELVEELHGCSGRLERGDLLGG
jgi:hypothetical protein